MEIKYAIEMKQRKALATAIGNYCGIAPKYTMPGFRYVIGDHIEIDKDGVVHLDSTYTKETAAPLLAELSAQGFRRTGTKEDEPEAPTSITLSVPCIDSDGHTLANVRAFSSAYSEILKHVFSTDCLVITAENSQLKFAGFKADANQDELRAAMDFIIALTNTAEHQKHMSSKPVVTDNEKYAFRTALIRIGLGGTAYKKSRKILLQNLSGNSAFRHGKAEKDDAVSEA